MFPSFLEAGSTFLLVPQPRIHPTVRCIQRQSTSARLVHLSWPRCRFFHLDDDHNQLHEPCRWRTPPCHNPRCLPSLLHLATSTDRGSARGRVSWSSPCTFVPLQRPRCRLVWLGPCTSASNLRQILHLNCPHRWSLSCRHWSPRWWWACFCRVHIGGLAGGGCHLHSQGCCCPWWRCILLIRKGTLLQDSCPYPLLWLLLVVHLLPFESRWLEAMHHVAEHPMVEPFEVQHVVKEDSASSKNLPFLLAFHDLLEVVDELVQDLHHLVLLWQSALCSLAPRRTSNLGICLAGLLEAKKVPSILHHCHFLRMPPSCCLHRSLQTTAILSWTCCPCCSRCLCAWPAPPCQDFHRTPPSNFPAFRDASMKRLHVPYSSTWSTCVLHDSIFVPLVPCILSGSSTRRRRTCSVVGKRPFSFVLPSRRTASATWTVHFHLNWAWQWNRRPRWLQFSIQLPFRAKKALSMSTLSQSLFNFRMTFLISCTHKIMWKSGLNAIIAFIYPQSFKIDHDNEICCTSLRQGHLQLRRVSHAHRQRQPSPNWHHVYTCWSCCKQNTRSSVCLICTSDKHFLCTKIQVTKNYC